MAKTIMKCPFSKGLCEECAIYRGRHYFLCFCEKYRGYIDSPGGTSERNSPGAIWADFNRKFEMPSIISTRAFDPFTSMQQDIKI